MKNKYAVKEEIECLLINNKISEKDFDKIVDEIKTDYASGCYWGIIFQNERS